MSMENFHENGVCFDDFREFSLKVCAYFWSVKYFKR